MILVLLLACFGQKAAPYQPSRLNDIWRISYAVGIAPIITMLVWRIFFLRVSTLVNLQLCQANDQTYEATG